ncbi:unnamed protein product [Rotaria sordida]|uniref:RBR-type E3 ubiquitin transferase n=1 Tax=Rotaria sordida TaxID=392033 RepID=A0A814HKK4_9BILA|nr:unnamed protein product [Rotaria sordida]CAF1178307.1 unnamed protein product [Rotaria sordida]CAF3844092.1 unnamed protein product [Rotaria sordida]CAF3847231.1 unnamed protein product [Rotaria sordida]
MSTADSEIQGDELDALTSILDETTFEINKKSTTTENTHGTLVIEVTLPDEFYIEYYPNQRRRVQYLPPIFLRFTLPNDYPSISSPSFQLECIWMSNEQLQILSKNLNNIWLDNSNEPILFLWYTSLSAQTLEWLNIITTLDLTLSFPSTITKSLQPQLTSAQVAATIHNYECEKKIILLSRTIITCPICLNDVGGNDCFLCYSCSGTACKSCIKTYLETIIHLGQVKSITCPINPSCNIELTPAQIASSVNKETFHRYDRLLFQLTIDSMDDIIYCPRCQKPVIVTQGTDDHLKNTLGECATCSFVFCTLCGKTFHGINPCKYSESKLKDIYKEYQNATQEERIALEQRYGKIFNRLMDDMASIETIKQTARQCPQCLIFVDKLDGCNKMTCIKCHSYFCWTCLDLLSKTDPYGHFNRPGSKCFNKLFEGVPGMEEWR